MSVSPPGTNLIPSQELLQPPHNPPHRAFRELKLRAASCGDEARGARVGSGECAPRRAAGQGFLLATRVPKGLEPTAVRYRALRGLPAGFGHPVPEHQQPCDSPARRQ